MTWKEVQVKIAIAIEDLRKVSRKYRETKPKLLCITCEAVLQAPIIGGFVFEADVWKNYQTAVKETIDKINHAEESHPEVQEKVKLLESWFKHFSKKVKKQNPIVSEAFGVADLVFTIYKVKKGAVRTTLIDAIFEEANKQVSYSDLLAVKN